MCSYVGSDELVTLVGTMMSPIGDVLRDGMRNADKDCYRDRMCGSMIFSATTRSKPS